MRIQEMRSGSLHLKKKSNVEVREDLLDASPDWNNALPANAFSGSDPKIDLMLDYKSELDEPRWAVVSFSHVEADGLTYREASELMFALDSLERTGLCIVTDKAAVRLED